MADTSKELQKEMEAVKKLLVLLLAKLGSDSKEIAMALGVDDSGVRKIIQMKKVTKIDFTKGKKE